MPLSYWAWLPQTFITPDYPICNFLVAYSTTSFHDLSSETVLGLLSLGYSLSLILCYKGNRGTNTRLNQSWKKNLSIRFNHFRFRDAKGLFSNALLSLAWVKAPVPSEFIKIITERSVQCDCPQRVWVLVETSVNSCRTFVCSHLIFS